MVQTMGEYSEQMPFEATLKVTKRDWGIEYYFPGPDRRYNGEFKRVSGASVDSYIRAFRIAWDEYVQLKQTLPAGGEFAKSGPNGLHIRVGGSFSGVSLHSYRSMVRSAADLEQIVASYEVAKRRAAQIQSLLFQL